MGMSVLQIVDLRTFVNVLMFDCTAQPGLSAVFMQLLGFEGVSFRAKDATQLGLCGMKARLEIHATQNLEDIVL